MWPGMRPATGMNAELHVNAAFGQGVVEFADFVLRLRHGHAIAGNDDNFARDGKNRRRLFGCGAANRPCFLAASRPLVCSWPNPPNSTFVNERFMALDMLTERIKPEAPSSAPATISSLLSSTKPIAAAESPAYGVQQRNHRRHVRAADRDNHHHAEKQRNRRSAPETSTCARDGAQG